jgi:hypothetical protein
MMQRGCALRRDWLAARLATRGRKERPKQRQAKQSRHDPPGQGTLRQQHNDALHSDTCSSHILHLHCTHQLEPTLC